MRRQQAPQQQEGLPIMRKVLVLLSATAMAAALLSTQASAWDGCGYGFHRNYSGYCVSNYRYDYPGYHFGWHFRGHHWW
jgi:hypothetical protein